MFWFRLRRILSQKKSLGFCFGKFGIVKKVSVSVSVKILVSSFSVREVVQKRKWIFFMTFAIGRRIPYPSNSTFLLHFLPILFVLQLYLTNWLISPERGKWSKYGIFKFFLELCCDQTVWFFHLFSPLLKRFCPSDSKIVIVLVLAHLKPELELFEDREILLLQIIITIIVNVINFKQL